MGTKMVVSLPSILAIQCFNLVCVVFTRPVGSIVVHSVVIDGGANVPPVWLCDQWCALKDIPKENALTFWGVQTENITAVQESCVEAQIGRL